MTDTPNDYVQKPVTTPVTYAASGVSPTSGVIPPVSANLSFSGPWLVETQSLTIDYVRVPSFGQYVTGFAISLSGTTSTYGSVGGTKLIAKVQAEYSRTLDYSNYNTSSYQQPQLFEVNGAVADINGVTYGSSVYVGTSALGAMGTVATTQEFYRRTPYNNETLLTSAIDSATFIVGTKVPASPGTVSTIDSSLYMQDFAFWHDPAGCRLGTLRNDGGAVQPFEVGNYGLIYGDYHVLKESPAFIISWIDTVATMVTNNRTFTPINPGLSISEVNTNYTSIPATVTTQSIRRGIPEYDKGRHQY